MELGTEFWVGLEMYFAWKSVWIWKCCGRDESDLYGRERSKDSVMVLRCCKKKEFLGSNGCQVSYFCCSHPIR